MCLSLNAIKPVYIITFLDGIIFFYAFKVTTTSSGYSFMIVFAIGKILGVFIGNKIEKKLALGLLEIDVYKHKVKGIVLADILRREGFSVTTTIGYGIEGSERLILRIVLPRNKFNSFHDILQQDGNINMSVKKISQIYGKIGSVSC